MRSAVWVEATKAMYSGNATTAMLAISSAWQRKVSQGRFSIMSVLHLAFDIAELHHGKADDDRHQDHRLRRGPAPVQALEAIVEHLVHQGRGRSGRYALRGCVEDAKGVEKGVHQVHHQQEERGRRQ